MILSVQQQMSVHAPVFQRILFWGEGGGKGAQGADPSPLPLSAAKADRNHLNE
jgi:hypothetical protein